MPTIYASDSKPADVEDILRFLYLRANFVSISEDEFIDSFLYKKNNDYAQYLQRFIERIYSDFHRYRPYHAIFGDGTVSSEYVWPEISRVANFYSILKAIVKFPTIIDTIGADKIRTLFFGSIEEALPVLQEINPIFQRRVKQVITSSLYVQEHFLFSLHSFLSQILEELFVTHDREQIEQAFKLLSAEEIQTISDVGGIHPALHPGLYEIIPDNTIYTKLYLLKHALVEPAYVTATNLSELAREAFYILLPVTEKNSDPLNEWKQILNHLAHYYELLDSTNTSEYTQIYNVAMTDLILHGYRLKSFYNLIKELQLPEEPYKNYLNLTVMAHQVKTWFIDKDLRRVRSLESKPVLRNHPVIPVLEHVEKISEIPYTLPELWQIYYRYTNSRSAINIATMEIQRCPDLALKLLDKQIMQKFKDDFLTHTWKLNEQQYFQRAFEGFEDGVHIDLIIKMALSLGATTLFDMGYLLKKTINSHSLIKFFEENIMLLFDEWDKIEYYPRLEQIMMYESWDTAPPALLLAAFYLEAMWHTQGKTNKLFTNQLSAWSLSQMEQKIISTLENIIQNKNYPHREKLLMGAMIFSVYYYFATQEEPSSILIQAGELVNDICATPTAILPESLSETYSQLFNPQGYISL